MDTIQISDFSFNFICFITPKKNSHDEIQTFFPQNMFNNNESLALHQYGQGPFCSFTISTKSIKEGVYLLKINDDITYLGECENLSKRFNSGYGNISPRNCFIGGQSTNCRINNKIYEVANEKVKIYFYETNNRFEVERELIMKLKPIWNISRGKRNLTHTNRSTNSNNFISTLPKKSLTCRDEILSAVRHIIQEKGSNEFIVREVIDTMRQGKSTYSESTIRTHIVSKCCINAAKHHAVVYNDFERIGRGLYKLIGGTN
ncbi:GIY-YIG nuclease family protein [Paenisporosarcina antarctica]|uniref:GIY-YIG nuclease family protein n=1 Tax=Paenisporosarcina antarctica TaxID=417367 RepID=A0A4P7A2T9_9BACL|nr:GIY-YIG nuclease family protein [Paenisporosarcina antarctica]QBP43187.1 GIY-YIG nuclease family protein [Paenisporosarcina antarctica]